MIPKLRFYDIVILGAGIAGSTCAWQIKQSSPALSVLVIDQSPFPRAKTCSGVVFSYSYKYLPTLPPDYVTSLNPVTHFAVETIPDTPQTTMIRAKNITRDVFDQWLMQSAEKAGAECCTECEFQYYAVGTTKCKVFFMTPDQARHNIDCRTIIDASGGNGVTHPQTYYNIPNERYTSLLTYIDGITTLKDYTYYLFKGSLFSDQYFAWACRKDKYWIIGNRVKDVTLLSQYTDQTMKWLGDHYKLIGKPVITMQDTQVWYKSPVCGNNRVLLIGDALYANPYRLFNIDFALLSANLCAEAIVKTKNASYPVILKNYQKAINPTLSRIARWHQITDPLSSATYMFHNTTFNRFASLPRQRLY